MRLFLVFREGVYRHALVSVSRAEADAHHNAKAALEAERDDYHSFGVYWVDTNKALAYRWSEQDTSSDGWDRPVLIGSYSQEVLATKPRRVSYKEAA